MVLPVYAQKQEETKDSLVWLMSAKSAKMVDVEGSRYRQVIGPARFLHNNTYVVGDYAICGTRGWFFDDETPHSEKVINRECGRLRMGIDAAKATGKEPLVFLHYPPVTTDRECTPIMDVLRESGISISYYAHLHGNAIARAFRGEKDGIRFDLVSADSMNFCPLLISR